MTVLNDHERGALRPAVGARLLLELDALLDGAGARARYVAWLLTADAEHAYDAILADTGEVELTARAGATDGLDDLQMLAKLTARGASRRAADGLTAWPPRVLRWRGPGRGA